MNQGQAWDPKVYARNAGYMVEMGAPVLDLLDPRPGERVLDLGCGDGVLTAKIVERGCRVVGVDSSAEQLEAASELGLDVRLMPAENLRFHEEFDAVFSNATLHWVRDHDAVLEGVWRALKPGGRFVGECGGAGNVAKLQGVLFRKLRERGLDPDSLNPWNFTSPDEFRTRLEARGFQVRSIDHFPKPMKLPYGITGWLDTFGLRFIAAVPEAEREAFKNEVQDSLRNTLRDEEGNWLVDYVRLRFWADKPEA